ncbi:acetyltransferase [Clostridium botulinum]|nr:acetyltransferase [Clostridium botulinum]
MQINNLLSDFDCKNNKDVSRFLKEKSIRFEQADKSRTYLIVPEENPLNSNGAFNILGYFTLAEKKITLPKNISKSKIQKYDGMDKKASEVNCYLIGQLGKNDKYKNDIVGKEILDYAINIIKKCREFIGGRLVLVECEKKKKLINFYNDNKFEYLTKDENTDLLQFVLPLNNTEFIKNQNVEKILNIVNCKTQNNIS